ncbi:MAG: DUF5702 domain-containing protein [Sakamotonia sp.]|jgi:hypothetical protein
MRQRGEITVFLSLTLVCILSLFMGLLESARTAGARLYLTMAANSSMASVMSQYNRNLWDMYRLLFLEYESPEAIGHSFDGYLDFYLEQENLYPMKRKSREVTAILNMQDNGGKPLEDGILSYVRYRLPDIAGNLTGITERAKEASRAGDFRTVFKFCRQAGRHTRRLEKARREAEAALEDMERLRIRASEAAADERAGRMGKEIERLQKKIRRFPELAGQYEKELEALSGNSRSAGEDGGREGMEEPLAAQTMDLELAAYQSVEEAGREFLEDCRKAELDLEDGLSRLEEIQGLLEEDGENGEGEEHAEGPDWDRIRELMDMVHIPETAPETVDQEKAGALDRLEELLEGDLLQLVLPEGVKASGKRAGAGDILADLRKGKAEEEAESNGPAEQLLVNEYILLYFDSFLKACEGREALTDQTLDYEQEYLLCGKRSDRENLAQTAEKLLMIRAAMNLLYLLSAPDKKAQADSLAAAVSGGNAAAGLIIGFLVLSLWALGEAVWDVRGLLDGGRTEFWKTDRTWHLSLEGLLAMEFLEGRTDMEASGSGYEDYIRLLLFLEDKTERNYRMMDVIQWNVRKKQKDFTAGSCACRVEIRTEVSQKHVFLIKNEYGQTVETAWTY